MTVSPEQRDAGLDLVRFVYITMMVTYHCFQASQQLAAAEMPNINRYLGLVSGSFPFLAGFLISHHYLKKLRAGNSTVGTLLIVRGTRLLSMYALINIAILLWLRNMFPKWPFPKSESPLLSILYVNPTYVAYDILAPLGLIMVIGGVCAWLYAWSGTASAPTLQVAVGVGGATLAILLGHPYLASGLAGLALGVGALDTVVMRTFGSRLTVVVAALYGPAFAIAFATPRDHELLYVIGVITLFYFIRGFAALLRLRSEQLPYKIRLFGTYSLLIYIVHVPALVLLSYTMTYFYISIPDIAMFAALLAVIYFLVNALLRVTDAMRKRFHIINSMYRIIFG